MLSESASDPLARLFPGYETLADDSSARVSQTAVPFQQLGRQSIAASPTLSTVPSVVRSERQSLSLKTPSKSSEMDNDDIDMTLKGNLFGSPLLFPFELTTSDYLHRLFSCLVAGIRNPVLRGSQKHCAPNGPMQVLSSADSRSPLKLLRCLLGISDDKTQTAADAESDSKAFEVQCLFFMYMHCRRSFVLPAQLLLREAKRLIIHEFRSETCGQLANLSLQFEAARSLLETFASKFKCSEQALADLGHLQIQAERHRRSKEERVAQLGLQWPQFQSALEVEKEALAAEELAAVNSAYEVIAADSQRQQQEENGRAARSENASLLLTAAQEKAENAARAMKSSASARSTFCQFLSSPPSVLCGMPYHNRFIVTGRLRLVKESLDKMLISLTNMRQLENAKRVKDMQIAVAASLASLQPPVIAGPNSPAVMALTQLELAERYLPPRDDSIDPKLYPRTFNFFFDPIFSPG